MKLDRQTKEQNESLYLKEIKLRESKIEELNQQVRLQNNNIERIFLLLFLAYEAKRNCSVISARSSKSS